MKTNYNGAEFSINRAGGYGQYVIEATYKGVELSIHSTNSEAFDWIDDDSNTEKQEEAINYCFREIKSAYEKR